MKKKSTIILAILGATLVVCLLGAWLLKDTVVAVLDPKGSIAQSQFDLIIFTTILSLVVVIPVFVMTFYVIWKYRASNKKAAYNPDWDHSRAAEAVWWGVPLVLIAILAVITWITSHSLDPYRRLESAKKPVTIQVIALDWKWLFIYPEQDIASVNYIQIPEDTPINFELTADAPMNSFWIPQLGGQVYAMAGMKTKLHLLATERGEYRGSSANISGEGFAGMKFTAKATSEADFKEWVQSVKASSAVLDRASYDDLAKPSRDNPVVYYSSHDKQLYDTVMMKYMMPQHQPSGAKPTIEHKEHRH